MNTNTSQRMRRAKYKAYVSTKTASLPLQTLRKYADPTEAVYPVQDGDEIGADLRA